MGPVFIFLFFFNDTATTEIYTLSLHDALPISSLSPSGNLRNVVPARLSSVSQPSSSLHCLRDRKSTRLNSSHQIISYAVFCLKKKKTITDTFPSTYPLPQPLHPPHACAHRPST